MLDCGGPRCGERSLGVRFTRDRHICLIFEVGARSFPLVGYAPGLLSMR